MAEENAEQIGLDQRATDPRLEQTAPAPEPAAEPIADAPAEETPAEAPETPVEPEVPVKARKSAEEVLKGRVGHLTKTLSAKDEQLAAAQARADAAEALLAAGQAPVDPAASSKPAGTYTQADFDAAVTARAEVAEFNRKADEMYNTGADKFQDWKDAVDTLVVSGFMNKDLVDSAMAIEDGPTVLHYLGTNLDEAERINALTPIRKVAEMAKIANTLGAAKSIPVSSAPAPISPVRGSPNPVVDLQRIADDNDMSAYAAARAKQGSRWANGRK
jgi:hypothetical protein